MIPLTKESDIPITNKENWIYNNYYCQIRYFNDTIEEYDTFGDDDKITHNFWNLFLEKEGIEILWD